MQYDDIFNYYTSSENIPFYILNRRIEFPADRSLAIYDKKYINTDTPWTILSHIIYKDIQYWWILSALNPGSIFYAKEGEEIYFIKEEYLSHILNNI